MGSKDWDEFSSAVTTGRWQADLDLMTTKELP